MKLSTRQIKIISFSLLISTALGGYLYLTKMQRISGNLNINKSNPIDILCNYTVYSDFYYRIVHYNKNENSYAELTPVKSTICYNLKNNKVELQSTIDEDSNIILDDHEGIEIQEKISLLDNFKTTYSKIIATQDKDYFIQSYENAKKTIFSLYEENIMQLPQVKDPLSTYYTQINNLPVNNMIVKYFNLTNIKESPIEIKQNEVWKPNILEWKFEENDRIYLQYLTKSSFINLDDYIKSKYAQSNKTLVKLTKFNNKKLNKMFLIFDDKQNKIKTLFMDNNGYIYILILQVSNKKSFNTYFDDYLKIAYGIFFIQNPNLNTSFIQEQKKAEEYYNQSLKSISNIMEAYKVLQENQSTEILKYYKEMLFTNKIINSKVNIQQMENATFDLKYKKFKELYGAYPNKKIYSKLDKNLKDLQLIIEGIEEYKPSISLFSDKNKYQKGSIKLQKRCNTLKCIEQLKLNNWEEKKND